MECNDLKRDWFFPLIRSFVGNVSTIDGEYIQMSEESGLGSEKEVHSVSDPIKISQWDL